MSESTHANVEFSGRIIEIDYERSTLLVRYEGAPPDVGSNVRPANDETRDDDLWDSAQRKLQAGETITKAEANAYFAAGLHNPINQVYFRAGLVACREYMARFVEAESPTIAASIRANWWPQLGDDYGPPRLLAWSELAEGEPQLGNFRVKTENWTPTLEALPIAAQFLQPPIPGPAAEEALKAEHTHGSSGSDGVSVRDGWEKAAKTPMVPPSAQQETE